MVKLRKTVLHYYDRQRSTDYIRKTMEVAESE